MTADLKKTLKLYFGFDNFRPQQEDIITSLLDGNDVLALMPTGGGKSLCYQVPALVKEGMCLVVSPLIALMNDQVQHLRRKNITAFSINTGMSRKDVVSVLKTASHSNCKFLYVSPERLETALFKEYLPGMDINFIVVDEAHCISQWGYDFRPPYLRIVQLREELPNVPVIALTASATPLVQTDICNKLLVDGAPPFTVFRQSFTRPNLSYSVFKSASRINKIVSVLQNVKGTAIVYCKTRKRTREISELLNLQGINADYYHAGLSAEERNKKQDEWINNKTRVIVCTNAFGMGIDKPDVRVVVHADVPDCLENYYQEAGRAGRDGRIAFAVLLYDDPELITLNNLPDVRYPTVEAIKTVYSCIVNYLQLPEGEAPGEYYDFDLKDFTRKFGLDIQTTIYGLKALEQDGWLSFNEQVFIPATIRFIVYKEVLYEYEKNNPEYEPLIKSLLRTYEGIYDYPVAVSEKFIGQVLQYEADLVLQYLHRLHADRVIDYQPQKNTPQIILNRPRIKTNLLQIDTTTYRERKTIFTDRVKKILEYINNTNACRSQMIATYFGDNSVAECGVCDTCLRKKRATLSRETFDKIQARLQSVLQQPATTKEALINLKGISTDHAWTVINFLVDEGKIFLHADGKLEWHH